MHNLKTRVGLSLAALVIFAASAPAAELRPFDTGSFEAIRAAHAGKPFVLALWSVYCAPCREEMALWKSMRRKYPQVPVVLVATDPPAERATVMKFLARYSPGPVEHWAFADDFSERVRFSIDRKWRGELPRTYFFDASHQSVARSGLLEQRWIEDWLSQQSQAHRERRRPAAQP
jgi:hypothetical protein